MYIEIHFSVIHNKVRNSKIWIQLKIKFQNVFNGREGRDNLNYLTS